MAIFNWCWYKSCSPNLRIMGWDPLQMSLYNRRIKVAGLNSILHHDLIWSDKTYCCWSGTFTFVFNLWIILKLAFDSLALVIIKNNISNLELPKLLDLSKNMKRLSGNAFSLKMSDLFKMSIFFRWYRYRFFSATQLIKIISKD